MRDVCFDIIVRFLISITYSIVCRDDAKVRETTSVCKHLTLRSITKQMLNSVTKFLIYKAFDGLEFNAEIAVFFIGKPPKEIISHMATSKHRKARLQQPGYLLIDKFSGTPRQVGPEIQPLDQPRVLLRDK